ncbi:hypothetical protein QN277_020413 [Acacia crassicarpa]|uniref:Protein phosphatase n=1 Tax=Acacia crassicarpa TaxID=499986 RepID=A0AAE1JMX4_9FABA|nr:hypothetical protein QN277_020413 [Acacia crassicarpa]
MIIRIPRVPPAKKQKISHPSPKLKMDIGVTYLPKPDRKKPRGEDCYFMLSDRNTVGVADGVGGWSSKGIDAGQYALELMQHAMLATLRQPKGSVNPRTVLNKAFQRTKSEGSSTACIATLKQNFGENSNQEYYSLHAVNVGDSGFMLFRNLKLVYRSPTQQHRFNTPYQLGNSEKSDTPEKAEEFTVEVAAGDIVVFGTDGVFDNLFPEEIQRFIELNCGGDDKVTAERLSRLIAKDAARKAYDKYSKTPFEEASHKAGKKFKGGKKDDITVVVAYIVSC